MDSLHTAARRALDISDPDAKIAATRQALHDWQTGFLVVGDVAEVSLPIFAGRPEKPLLIASRDLPARKLGNRAGHAALIHSLVHIEFNAINLGLDAAYRFRDLPNDFYTDWLTVAAEEAYHFDLLRSHLRSLGYEYGAFPAHGGLWELAEKTALDPLARMALVPRLMEARGLDVTPDIQHKLRSIGDKAGAAILDIILRDEIGHVAAGNRWFHYLCGQRGIAPEQGFLDLLNRSGLPPLRPPFNIAARVQAGFSTDELARLAETQ